MHIPLERFVVNFMTEIPLPDNGSILVSHDFQSESISFFRPVDQYPPYCTRVSIESLFKAMTVEDIIEVFLALLVERKVLLISRHKSLLTHAAVSLISFLFPLHWVHTLIPLLP